MTDNPIEFDPKQFRQVLAVLNKINADTLRPFLNDVGQRLVADFKLGFSRSKAPDNTPWKPLKHRQGEPLRDTNRLQNSLNHKVKGKTVAIGTNVPYGKAHQFGLKEIQVPQHTKLINQAFGKPLKYPVYATVKAHTAKVNVPARPFLGIEKRQRNKIVRAFEAHIEQLTNGQATGSAP